MESPELANISLAEALLYVSQYGVARVSVYYTHGQTAKIYTGCSMYIGKVVVHLRVPVKHPLHLSAGVFERFQEGL